MAVLFLGCSLIMSGCHVRYSNQYVQNRLMPDILNDDLVLIKVATLSAADFYDQMGKNVNGYITYDLHQVQLYDYQDNSIKKVVLRVEVFTCGSSLDAYGLARYLTREKESIYPGLETTGSTGLPGGHIFYKDRYMVRLLPYGSGEIGEEEIRALVAETAGILPGRSNAPEEVEMLTSLGASLESIYYEPALLLGTKLLAPGLTAEVEWPTSGKLLLFIALKDMEEGAQKAFGDYLMKKSQGVKGVSFTLGIGDVACTVWDDVYGWVNMAKSGRYIVGVAGAYNPAEGWPVVTRIISSLEEKDR